VAKTVDLPSGVTTNLQLHRLAKRMQIPYFRGVFMRNALPREIRRNECGIVNLDDAIRSGMHWIAYAKRGNRAMYFDSFGNLRPPIEIARYLGNNTTVMYNRENLQTYDQNICGQLCLRFLSRINWSNKSL